MIEVEHVSFRYPPARRGLEARTALADVSFRVEKGEIFGLLGPNGGGKTTLFRILATLHKPSAGTARIGGRDVGSEAAAVRRLLAVTFQSPSLDRKLTVSENLLHHGHLYGLRGPQLAERIAKVLERMRLGDRAGDLVETLSGGMSRRVELAKAMLHQPAVLLLDEPSTGLDPGARIDFWDYLDRLRREEGITALLTTHLMDEAARCDRLALLDRGRIVALGTPYALTSEIGGDVVSIDTDNPELLLGEIRLRFGEAALLDGKLRVESLRGHRLIPQLVEAFPGRIRAISLSKPTLEDVFIRRTGHGLGEET